MARCLVKSDLRPWSYNRPYGPGPLTYAMPYSFILHTKVYVHAMHIDQNEDTLSRDIVPIQFDTQGSWLGTDANGARD